MIQKKINKTQDRKILRLKRIERLEIELKKNILKRKKSKKKYNG